MYLPFIPMLFTALPLTPCRLVQTGNSVSDRYLKDLAGGNVDVVTTGQTEAIAARPLLEDC